MTKVIDGKNATLGRLASFAAKESLKGEEIVIVNCEEIIITGSKQNIRDNFLIKRGRVGSGQSGPKISRDYNRIVKRTIRGMLPDHRSGRGKEAFRRIKCYNGTPKEFETVKKLLSGKEKSNKFIRVKEIH
jgi:large subunit ribosomal protein L13